MGSEKAPRGSDVKVGSWRMGLELNKVYSRCWEEQVPNLEVRESIFKMLKMSSNDIIRYQLLRLIMSGGGHFPRHFTCHESK